MRLFKCRRNPDVCWPLDDRSATSDASTNSESDPADPGSMILDLGSAQKSIRFFRPNLLFYIVLKTLILYFIMNMAWH